MAIAEANLLIEYGKHWQVKVWANGADPKVQRTAILDKLNAGFKEHGITFRASNWQNYEHVVHVKDTPLRYKDICKALADANDGGVAYAVAFQAWYSTTTAGLLDLPPVLQALAVITHFSEVARGYLSALAENLYPWVAEITAAKSAGAAKALWMDFLNRFPPSATYAEDSKTEVVLA